MPVAGMTRAALRANLGESFDANRAMWSFSPRDDAAGRDTVADGGRRGHVAGIEIAPGAPRQHAAVRMQCP